MRVSPLRAVVFWAFPVGALVLAALASGGFEPWFFYALMGVAVGILAAVLGPWAIGALARRLGHRRALLLASAVGWAVIGGGLLILNWVTEQRISWAVYPAIGLAMWPLGVWYFTGQGTTQHH